MNRILPLLILAVVAVLLGGACNNDEATYGVRYTLQYSGPTVNVESVTYTGMDGTPVVIDNPENGFEVEFEVEKGFVARFEADGTIFDGEVAIFMRLRRGQFQEVVQDIQEISGTTLPITIELEETL